MDWLIYIQCENFDLYGSLLLTMVGVWGTVVFAYMKSKGGVK